jgi:hypothetical protein
MTTATIAKSPFESQIKIPPRRYWSRRAAAKFLAQQGLVGADISTLDRWEWQKKLWRTIPEFKAEIPRDANGDYIKGYCFTPFQMWVVVKTAHVATILREDKQGCAYLEELAGAIANPEIQRRYLSRAVWLWELNQVA